MIVNLITNTFKNKFNYPSSCYLESEENNRLTILLTGRDTNGYSKLFKVILDASDFNILSISDPIMIKGSEDKYDKCGNSYPCIVNDGFKRVIFYTGWSFESKNRFLNTLCSIEMMDDEYRNKKTNIVIAGKNRQLIYEIGSVDIIRSSDEYFMYFTKFTKWNNGNPFYQISLAKSANLETWRELSNFNFINYPSLEQELICRPSLLFRSNKWWMLFCYRNLEQDYKIGLASSSNLYDWTIENNNIFTNIDLPNWCSFGQCYPHYVKTNNNTEILFFGGNCYGRDGFGFINLNKLNLF